MNFLRSPKLSLASLLLVTAPMAEADLVTTSYGDADGFGVGEIAGTITDADVSHAGPGEAPFTDVGLIGSFFTFPAFLPTGNFLPFVIPAGETIFTAVLTLRTGSFDSGPNPLEPPNQIFLDGLLVDPEFINSFSPADTDNIETLSYALDSSFFASLSDGTVSLNGTRITEAGGSGSFQVDFLRLDVITLPIPECSPALLSLTGAILLAGRRRRRI